MNLNDLWIGDKIRLKKSRRIGSFEGIDSSGKARIKVHDKVILSMPANLELVDEQEIHDKNPTIEISQQTPITLSPEYSIDLHIEALQPDLQHQLPQMILNKQVSACEAFVLKAISVRQKEALIIHGRGEGQLQLEVEMILKTFSEVANTELINNEGATKVTFQYSS